VGVDTCPLVTSYCKIASRRTKCHPCLQQEIALGAFLIGVESAETDLLLASIKPALSAGGTGYRVDERPSVRCRGPSQLPDDGQAFAHYQSGREQHQSATATGQEFALEVSIPVPQSSRPWPFGAAARQTWEKLDLYVAVSNDAGSEASDNDEGGNDVADYSARVAKADTLIIMAAINNPLERPRLDRVERIAQGFAAPSPMLRSKPKDVRSTYFRWRSRPKQKCVYVVVGRYETILDGQPDRAVTDVLAPDEVRAELYWFLRRNSAFNEVLQDLSARCPVYLLPQSSFGLIRGFDGPNVVLGQSDEPMAEDQPLLAPGATGELDKRLGFHPSREIDDEGRSRALMFRDYWLPLFSADAFVAAATGWRHAWFIDYATVGR
jgi:hypothetical protein